MINEQAILVLQDIQRLLSAEEQESAMVSAGTTYHAPIRESQTVKADDDEEEASLLADLVNYLDGGDMDANNDLAMEGDTVVNAATRQMLKQIENRVLQRKSLTGTEDAKMVNDGEQRACKLLVYHLEHN